MSRQSWLRSALRFRGSVIPAILPRTLLCVFFGVFVSVLYFAGLPVHIPAFASIIPNVVLGLMLVFRTNTAYERFWEGRKLWGSLNNAIRNLARQIWVIVLEKDAEDRQEKVTSMYLLVAFAVATKLHLRQQAVNQELEALLSYSRYTKLKTMNNPPLEIAFWIQDYLQKQYYRKGVDAYQLINMQKTLDEMVDYLGGCERILKTPIPTAYAIHLKQLLLLYCLTLPFQFVDTLGWWAGPLAGLISFTLFGIEEIGIEIENPFGCDRNDLPLDAICETIRRNMEDLMTLDPISSKVFWLQEDPGSERNLSESKRFFEVQ